jgi:hypothetical protein
MMHGQKNIKFKQYTWRGKCGWTEAKRTIPKTCHETVISSVLIGEQYGVHVGASLTEKRIEKFKDVWITWAVIHATDVKVGTISHTSIVKTSNNLQPAVLICPALLCRQSFGRMGEDITNVKIRLSGMWNREVTYSR